MMKKFTRTFLVLIIGLAGCTSLPKKDIQFSSKEINTVLSHMTSIMIKDITNPPLAARFFSYACLAGYEVISQHDSLPSLHGILNQYPDLIKTDSIKGYHVQLTALLAMMETSKKIQPSGYLMNSVESQFIDSCKKIGFTEDQIAHSLEYAISISKKILAYAKADGYTKISNYERYSPSNEEGFWYPTPPGFMAAVEPYFKTIRPFVLDSGSQFKPIPPIAFSTDKKSPFFQQMELNANEKISTMSMDHKVIAAFWDCNPFAVQTEGHLMVGIKKISPGAHWLGITGIACHKANKTFEQSMQIFTSVAIGLTDAFISCWDEKYRSNRIRPETAIRKYIDVAWQPLLQTPPFPEYPSGHSVASSTTSVILTHYFGDSFAYTDNVEVNYGLPARSFSSFDQAAREAAISRFYGGIHFMDAIDNGFTQGTQIGHYIIQQLSRNDSSSKK